MSAKPAYIITAAMLVVGAWMFRYEIVGAGSGDRSPMAYRLDRWTGNILLAVPAGTLALEEIKPERPKDPNPFDQFDK